MKKYIIRNELNVFTSGLIPVIFSIDSQYLSDKFRNINHDMAYDIKNAKEKYKFFLGEYEDLFPSNNRDSILDSDIYDEKEAIVKVFNL